MPRGAGATTGSAASAPSWPGSPPQSPTGSCPRLRNDARLTTDGYRRDVVADLRSRLTPHALTVAAAVVAVAALIEDIARETVTIDGHGYDRGPDVVIVGALAVAVLLIGLRRQIGLLAPIGALAVFGVAALPARAWALNSPDVFVLVMMICGLSGFMSRGRWFPAAIPVIAGVAAVA